MIMTKHTIQIALHHTNTFQMKDMVCVLIILYMYIVHTFNLFVCLSEDVELEQRITHGALSDSAHRTSEVSSTMRSQNLDKNVDLVKMQVINTTINAVEPERSMSSIVSISEKKYIENLYEQLNTSKVLKKEVRSDFDDLDAMLKEID